MCKCYYSNQRIKSCLGKSFKKFKTKGFNFSLCENCYNESNGKI